MPGGKRPGAGRKSVATKLKIISFRLTDEMQAAGLTAPLVRQIIQAWLDLENLQKAWKPYVYPDYLSPPPAPPVPRCQRCGIKLEGAMGYACGKLGCPTGLGGTQC